MKTMDGEEPRYTYGDTVYMVVETHKDRKQINEFEVFGVTTLLQDISYYVGQRDSEGLPPDIDDMDIVDSGDVYTYEEAVAILSQAVTSYTDEQVQELVGVVRQVAEGVHNNPVHYNYEYLEEILQPFGGVRESHVVSNERGLLQKNERQV